LAAAVVVIVVVIGGGDAAVVVVGSGGVAIADVGDARVSRVSRSRRLDFCNVCEPNDGSIGLSPRLQSFSTDALMFNVEVT